MRIAFVLPAPSRVPSGGPLVVMQHAQGLAERGHTVRVVAPKRIAGETGWVRSVALGVANRIQGVAEASVLERPGVRLEEPPRLRDIELDDDAVIATGIQTLGSIKDSEKGWWFVQGDETFVRPDARTAWRLPVRTIPCSEWLATEIRAAGGTVAGVVPNAVDPDRFGIDTPIRARDPHVLALYHRHPVKGPETLLSVLRDLRRERPDVRLTVFSARTPSHRMPGGVDVVVRPDADQLRALYNASSVFLHTSRSEGWALTPMEAAACGAAVVATDSRGPSEYLTADRSMLCVPVDDADGLLCGALALLDDTDRRVELATAAFQDVNRFDWASSTDRLEQILLSRGGG